VIYFPNGWKDIQWPANPSIGLGLTDQVKIGDHWITKVRIKSNQFVRLCHVLLKEKYESQILPVSKHLRIECSDNYFDLPAGEEHFITITSLKKLTREDLHVGHWNTEWE